jgi:hypothetical protein
VEGGLELWRRCLGCGAPWSTGSMRAAASGEETARRWLGGGGQAGGFWRGGQAEGLRVRRHFDGFGRVAARRRGFGRVAAGSGRGWSRLGSEEKKER